MYLAECDYLVKGFRARRECKLRIDSGVTTRCSTYLKSRLQCPLGLTLEDLPRHRLNGEAPVIPDAIDDRVHPLEVPAGGETQPGSVSHEKDF